MAGSKKGRGKQSGSRPSSRAGAGDDTEGGDGAKENTLVDLCVRFLDMCRGLESGVVELTQATEALKIGRRRIYDVVNVLEALTMMVRLGKARYAFYDVSSIPALVVSLKKEINANHWSGACLVDEDADDPPRKFKNLAQLTRQFVKILIATPDHSIALEPAAEELVAMDTFSDPDKIAKVTKSKVRRLYDVANILMPLGLVAKHHRNGSTKRRVYVWTGPDLDTTGGPVTLSAQAAAMVDVISGRLDDPEVTLSRPASRASSRTQQGPATTTTGSSAAAKGRKGADAAASSSSSLATSRVVGGLASRPEPEPMPESALLAVLRRRDALRQNATVSAVEASAATGCGPVDPPLLAPQAQRAAPDLPPALQQPGVESALMELLSNDPVVSGHPEVNPEARPAYRASAARSGVQPASAILRALDSAHYLNRVIDVMENAGMLVPPSLSNYVSTVLTSQAELGISSSDISHLFTPQPIAPIRVVASPTGGVSKVASPSSAFSVFSPSGSESRPVSRASTGPVATAAAAATTVPAAAAAPSTVSTATAGVGSTLSSAPAASSPAAVAAGVAAAPGSPEPNTASAGTITSTTSSTTTATTAATTAAATAATSSTSTLSTTAPASGAVTTEMVKRRRRRKKRGSPSMSMSPTSMRATPVSGVTTLSSGSPAAPVSPSAVSVAASAVEPVPGSTAESVVSRKRPRTDGDELGVGFEGVDVTSSLTTTTPRKRQRPLDASTDPLPALAPRPSPARKLSRFDVPTLTPVKSNDRSFFGTDETDNFTITFDP